MEHFDLPTPYIFCIDTPLVLFNGRLLQPKQQTEDDDNYAEFYSKRFSLEEIITPKKLEELYFRHNAAQIEGFQQSFVQGYFNQEFQSRESISNALRENKVLSLIVEKILPVITAGRLESRIEDIVRDDGPTAQAARAAQQANTEEFNTENIPESVMREVNATKRQLISQIEEQYRGLALDSQEDCDEISDRIQDLLRPAARASSNDTFTRLNEDSALSEMLGNNNMMVINGKLYSLMTIKDFLFMFEEGVSPRFFEMAQRFYATTEPDSIVRTIENNKELIDHKYLSRIVNKIQSSKLKVNGKYYIPFLWGKTSDLSDKYKLFLEKRMKTDAVEHSEYQTREIYRITQERRRLESIATRSQYERNNAGFVNDRNSSNSFYVYVTTPAYALKSPHFNSSDCYMPFRPAKIGVKIKYFGGNRNDAFEVSSPVIMHSYTHPFLGNASAYARICLGSWGERSESRLHRMPPDQKALTLLAQAQKTLMMGYRSGSNPYIRLYRNEWRGWLTKEEVERQGLVVLNDFGR